MEVHVFRVTRLSDSESHLACRYGVIEDGHVARIPPPVGIDLLVRSQLQLWTDKAGMFIKFKFSPPCDLLFIAGSPYSYRCEPLSMGEQREFFEALDEIRTTLERYTITP